MSEVADFLRAHAPFDALDPGELERVAAAADLETHPAGATIFDQGAAPVTHLRVVRSGAVDLVSDGQVLDRLEPGELLGHPSMLSGLPTGAMARAAQDTVVVRIPDDVARELLARPEGVRYVARSLVERMHAGGRGMPDGARAAARQPVATLIRGAPVVCRPDTTIRHAAHLMGEAGQSAAVIELGDGTYGIVTDRDLRTRVVATGITVDTPVAAVMSAPAYTSPPDRLAGDVVLDMLDRGLRHFPVVAGTGEVLGVVDDMALVAAEARTSFQLRRSIARAATVEEVAAAGKELPRLLIALHDARVAAHDVAAIQTVVLDSLVRRLLELAVAAAPGPLPPFAWLALGSQARRELAPNSDVDSAIAWFAPEASTEEVLPALHRIGSDVCDGLEACGLRRDDHGANAATALFVRSIESWQQAARGWLDDPTQEQAGILVSVFVEARPVWGVHLGNPLSDTLRSAADNATLLRLLARMALARRPPTGFLRGLVVEDSGEHRGQLDLKSGGLVPIVNLARWAGIAAGVTTASTRERLRAAADAGTLPAQDARLLREAFDLLSELRLEHQVEQLRAGEEPNDFLDPADLSALMRAQLKEAFRAVAAVQKRV